MSNSLPLTVRKFICAGAAAAALSMLGWPAYAAENVSNALAAALAQKLVPALENDIKAHLQRGAELKSASASENTIELRIQVANREPILFLAKQSKSQPHFAGLWSCQNITGAAIEKGVAIHWVMETADLAHHAEVTVDRTYCRAWLFDRVRIDKATLSTAAARVAGQIRSLSSRSPKDGDYLIDTIVAHDTILNIGYVIRDKKSVPVIEGNPTTFRHNISMAYCQSFKWFLDAGGSFHASFKLSDGDTVNEFTIARSSC